MKRISQIIFLSALMFWGCEKQTGDPFVIKFYGDAFEDIGYSVVIAPDGYIIAGQLEEVARKNGIIVDTTANKNLAVIKTGWDGKVMWKVTAGGRKDDMGSKLYQLTDGSVLCVGTSTDTTSGNFRKDIMVVKISSSGEVLWKKSYNRHGNQDGKDIAETSYGYLVLGSTDLARPPYNDSLGNVEGNLDFYFLRINDNGDTINSFAAGYSGNERPASLLNTGGDNCIALGTTDRSWTGMGENNILITEVYPQATTPGPNRIIGTLDDEYANGIARTADGYMIAGTVGDAGTDQQAYVVRIKQNIFDPVVFAKKFIVQNVSTAVNAIAPYGTDNYVLAGYSGVYPVTRMLVFEMNGDGEPVAGNEMLSGSSGNQEANAVVAGEDGYIIAAGMSKYDINSMIAFLKFRF